MPHSRVPRVFFVLMIAATLATSPAWAAPRRAQIDSSNGVMARLWHSLTALWADEGCIIDPHGGCATGKVTPPPPSIDAGCILDPNGSCAPGH